MARKRTAKQQGKASREKGQRYERAIAARMRALFPGNAERIRRGWQSRDGDDDPDVVALPYRLWSEAKHHKLVPLRAALRQAVKGAPEGAVPIVFAKDDPKKPGEPADDREYVFMRLSDWERLVRVLLADVADA